MVTYIPSDSWDRVYLLIKQGLRQANYPNLARGPGGTANICCIVGWYQKGTPSQNDNVADQFTKLEQDGDLIRFTTKVKVMVGSIPNRGRWNSSNTGLWPKARTSISLPSAPLALPGARAAFPGGRRRSRGTGSFAPSKFLA